MAMEDDDVAAGFPCLDVEALAQIEFFPGKEFRVEAVDFLKSGGFHKYE